MVVMYLLSAVGITSASTACSRTAPSSPTPGSSATFAVLGSLAIQGSVLDWVADHRKHHALHRHDGDPHSPHVGHGSGWRGLWHAHAGWLIETQGQADWQQVRPRSLRGPGDAPDRQALSRCSSLLRSLIPTVAGFVLNGFTALGRARGLHLGRPRADLPRPPRDLVDQLDLPHVRSPPLRGRRPVDERLVARAVLARRVLAPQPSRLPALGLPRAEAGTRSTSPGS